MDVNFDAFYAKKPSHSQRFITLYSNETTRFITGGEKGKSNLCRQLLKHILFKYGNYDSRSLFFILSLSFCFVDVFYHGNKLCAVIKN